jgi:Fibronectin type III domain
MQKFGAAATRLQLTTLFVIALVLGGCSGSSSTTVTSASGPGTVTLTWIAPTGNTNGTPLTDLAGYHIHYGTSQDNLTKVIDLAGTGTTEYEVSGLAPGTYYFAISAYTAMGTESAQSDVGNKTI